MDLFNLLFILCGLTYIGITIYLANQLEINRVARLPLQGMYAISGQDTQAIILRWMLYGIIMVMIILGLMLVQMALLSQVDNTLSEHSSELGLGIHISAGAAVVGVLVTAFCAGASYTFVHFDEARRWLQARLNPKASFNAESSVHLVALVLMLAIMDWSVMTFLFQGGVQGMAESLAETGVQPTDMLFNLVLALFVSFMGIGLAFRRDLPQSFARLGLRIPTLGDVTWGFLTAIVFIGLMVLFNIVWSMFVPTDQINDQTVALQQLNRSLATLPLAFLVALTASVGEEIWLRGALQPVFGIGLSSIFFASMHTQTGLTPAILLILALSVGLGVLRQKVSTTAAIIAHFFFNFIPLALLSFAAEVL